MMPERSVYKRQMNTATSRCSFHVLICFTEDVNLSVENSSCMALDLRSSQLKSAENARLSGLNYQIWTFHAIRPLFYVTPLKMTSTIVDET